MKDAVSLKDRPLFQNYKNWLAMARLLDSEVGHLPGLVGEVTTAKFSTNEATEILRYFNWAPTSYYKKRRLFLWAYSVAYMSWNGPAGSERLHLSLLFLLIKKHQVEFITPGGRLSIFGEGGGHLNATASPKGGRIILRKDVPQL